MSPSLYVVEVDGDAYLGTLEVRRGGVLAIRSGYRGRPFVVDLVDVDVVTPAELHPDVVL